jgi:hypothetical protein
LAEKVIGNQAEIPDVPKGEVRDDLRSQNGAVPKTTAYTHLHALYMECAK